MAMSRENFQAPAGPDDVPTLYDYWSSSAAYRVRIGLALKGIAYRRVVVRRLDGIEQPDYFAVNPQGFVPTLEVAGERLIQSTAILEYLEERWRDPPLLPTAPTERARVRALTALVVGDIQPLNNQRVQDALLVGLRLRRRHATALVPSLDRRGLCRHRAAPGREPGHPPLLPRRFSDPGRRLPGAAGVQCSALVVRPRALSAHPPRRCRLQRARAVQGRSPGAAKRLPGLGAFASGSITPDRDDAAGRGFLGDQGEAAAARGHHV